MISLLRLHFERQSVTKRSSFEPVKVQNFVSLFTGVRLLSASYRQKIGIVCTVSCDKITLISFYALCTKYHHWITL